MDTGLERFLREPAVFFAPLRRALASGEDLASFFGEFGYSLDPADWDLAIDELGPLGTALVDFGDAVAALPPGPVDAGDLAALAPLIPPILAAIADPRTAGATLAALGLGEEFGQEVLDRLLHAYLSRRLPMLNPLLAGIGALVVDHVPAAESGRPADHVRVRFDWARLRQLFEDFDGWAQEMYGWGVDFQDHLAITRLAAIIDGLGPPPYMDWMTPAQVTAFVPNLPPAAPRPALAYLPVFDEVSPDPDGELGISAEAGLVVMPFGDATRRTRRGLAFAPYLVGNAGGDHQLSPVLTVRVAVDAQAVGGAVVAVRPDGVELAGGGAAEAEFQFGLKAEHPGGHQLPLIGGPSGTRIDVTRFHAAVGGSLDGDLFVAAGLEGLRIVVDLSGDGLLGSLASGPIELEVEAILVGWRPGRGVYFEGGSALQVTVPVALALGPIRLDELGIGVEIGEPPALELTTTGSVAIGPLFAGFEGLGVRIRPPPGPLRLAPDALRFDLVLPTGYAVALGDGPVEGGGYLSVSGSQYRGALALRMELLAFSAFGILTTELPGGRDGFSFVACIFGELDIPLGYGFFLTGLGGIVGVNRTADSEALRRAVVTGSLDWVLFPADPVAQATAILDQIDGLFPAREGQHVFGPVARITFGRPTLVEGKLGVVLETGATSRVLILGVITSDLPTRDVALVALRVSLFGEIDLAKRTISLDGSLEGSRVLTYPITGDMAARSGWAPRIDHVVSFGGLHPAYPRPPNLPDLRRLSINFGSNNPRVTLTAYLAVTTNSLQFGGDATLYAKGPKVMFVGRLAAEGELYLHALVYFDPFAFDAKLGGSLSLLVDGDVVLGLGFDLHLTGPNPFYVNGRVWATVFGIDVGFGIEHTWGDSREVAAPVADPVAVLRGGIAAGTGVEPIPTTDRVSGVVFVPPAPGADVADPIADPAAGLRYLQRAVPLAVPIDKLGEAGLAGGPHRYDVAVLDTDGTDLTLAGADADFVRGHYWRLTEDERLRAPAFEQHRAGFVLGGAALSVDPSASIDAEYQYEVILLPNRTGPRVPAPVFADAAIADAVLTRWSHVHRSEVARPRTPEAAAGVASAPVRLAGTAYVPLGGDPADAGSLTTVLEGRADRGRTAAANPAIADYVLSATG